MTRRTMITCSTPSTSPETNSISRRTPTRRRRTNRRATAQRTGNDDDDDDGVDTADGDETMREVDDVATKKGKTSTKPSKRKEPIEESDEETKFCEDDDIDALFEKAEKKKKKTLASWDDLPGDADDLSKALKPRKKAQIPQKVQKTGKK